MNLRLEDVVRSTNRTIILPGDPEPEWLWRNAEHRRVLAQMQAERREQRNARLPRRIVSRVRTALAGI